MSLNIKGQPLETCSCEPMTGFYRDGLCRTDKDDRGRHVVCAVMTETFLSYSKAAGNDLSTPRPEFDFPGLKAGDLGAFVLCAGYRPMRQEWRLKCAWRRPTIMFCNT